MRNSVILAVLCVSPLLVVEPLEWRFVSNEDALCNDFTRAGYYLRNTTLSHNWVVFLEGGSACYSPETCNMRCTDHETHLRYLGGEDITQTFDITRAWIENAGTGNTQNFISPFMTSIFNLTNGQNIEIEGTDILSTDCSINPDFCDYNHILIPYCSSDFWLGNDTRFNTSSNTDFEFAPDATDMQFIFKGFVIFQSVIREAIPTNTTGTVLLAGSSSGGIGALNHAKWVNDYLLDADIRVFTDSAWFVNFHDNLFGAFTFLANISDNATNDNSNVIDDSETSIYIALRHHEPCNSVEYGPPCCLLPYCLMKNPIYLPSNIPVLAAFSIYDFYLLAPSLSGVEPYNVPEASFEFNFNGGEQTEPIGLNFNFLRIIGEYGGVMNSTLDITSHQSQHLSYYVTSCLQHIYLATSSLWGEDGCTNMYEFNNNIAIRYSLCCLLIAMHYFNPHLS